MKFIGLPEKQCGGVENRRGEDETDWGEVVGQGNQLDDQSSVENSQKDRACYI